MELCVSVYRARGKAVCPRDGVKGCWVYIDALARNFDLVVHLFIYLSGLWERMLSL